MNYYLTQLSQYVPIRYFLILNLGVGNTYSIFKVIFYFT